MSTSILITGSRGFIGRAVIERMRNNPEILTIVPMDLVASPDTALRGDVVVATDVKHFAELAFGPPGAWKTSGHENAIIHLAGMLGTGELNDYNSAAQAVQTNILGTLNVLEAARQFDARVIMIGKPNVWLNTYTITKAAAQAFTQMFVREHSVPAVVLAPFNVFGPGQPMAPYRKAVPHMIREARSGSPLTVYGSGDNTVDMVWVDDVAECIVRAATRVPREKCVGAVWDVGTGVEMTVNAVAHEIAGLVQSTLGTETLSPIQHIPMRSGEIENTRLVADTAHIARFLDFVPDGSLTTFRRRMQVTIEWYNAVLPRAHIGTSEDYQK